MLRGGLHLEGFTRSLAVEILPVADETERLHLESAVSERAASSFRGDALAPVGGFAPDGQLDAVMASSKFVPLAEQSGQAIRLEH